MGNSVVDLGAAAVDYVKDVASDIGEGIESFYDYLTESPKASAGGYYKRLGPGARQYFSGPGEDDSPSILDRIGFSEGGAVDLGAGSPEEMEKFLEFLRKNRPVYKEGDERPYTYYSDMLMVPEEKRNTFEQEYETLPRADMYQDFAEPSYGITLEDIEKGTASLSDLQDEVSTGNPYAGTSGNLVPQQIEVVDGKVITNPVGFQNGGDVPEGIMSVDLGMGADTTGPDTMKPIPQYPGIEGFDIYKDLAPEQFDRRKIQDQRFNESRQFQKGQMVQRDDAVGGKLLKQAGIMTPVDQVKQTVDPKVMDQMSRILGRDIV